MECVAFHFLNNHLDVDMTSCKDSSSSNCERMVLWESMKNHFQTWIGTRPWIQWKSLGCAGGDYTECWTLALTTQETTHLFFSLLLIFKAFWICTSQQCSRFSKQTLADRSAHGSSARPIPMKSAQQGDFCFHFSIWIVLKFVFNDCG